MALGLTKAFPAVLSALVGAALGTLGAWISMTERVSVLERADAAIESRLNSLENGRTTPMSAESRVRFEEITRELDHIEADHRRSEVRGEELLRLHLEPSKK